MSVTRIEDNVAITRSDADDAALYGPPVVPQPPPPRSATAKQTRYALTALNTRDAWESAVNSSSQATQDWWGWCDPIIEDAPKFVRLCGKVGHNPKDVMDMAVLM